MLDQYGGTLNSSGSRSKHISREQRRRDDTVELARIADGAGEIKDNHYVGIPLMVKGKSIIIEAEPSQYFDVGEILTRLDKALSL